MVPHYRIAFVFFVIGAAESGCQSTTSTTVEFVSGNTVSETGQDVDTSTNESFLPDSETNPTNEGTAGESASDTGSFNSSPIAIDDDYFFTAESSLHISAANGLLKNDEDPNGDIILVVDISPTDAGGTITFHQDGSFDYAPPSKFWGCDSAVYTIADSQGATAQAIVRLQVDPPQVQQLATMVTENRAVRISGVEDESGTGANIAPLGDMNNDGYDDILVDTSGYKNDAILGGHLYVVYGRSNTNQINLTDVLAGNGGFPIIAESDFVKYNSSVDSIADLNGDGQRELLIGAVERAYVVFGQSEDHSQAIHLKDLHAQGQGFAIDPQQGDTIPWGSTITSIGDLNGDQRPEIAVAFINFEAAVHIIFGHDYDEDIALDDVGQTIPGYVIDKSSEFQTYSLANAGDMNGDHLDDLIIGSMQSAAYVVFGQTDMQTLKLSEVEIKKTGFKLIPDSNVWLANLAAFPNYATGLGDINHDGFADILVGGNGRSQNKDKFEKASTAYIIYGKNDSLPILADDIFARNGGFAIRGQDPWVLELGMTTSQAGFDMNRDGVNELLIGESEANQRKGRIFLVKSRSESNLIDFVTNTNTEGVFRFDPPNHDRLGRSIKPAGDFNGDGSPDFMAGAIALSEDEQSLNPGQVYVVFGPRQCLLPQ